MLELRDRTRGLRPGKKRRVGLVHFLEETGLAHQHGDFYDFLDRTAGRLNDGLHIAQRLPRLLLHGRAGNLAWATPGSPAIRPDTNTKPFATTA